jgi:Sugar phosphate isomerases/epimerases
MQNKLKLAFSTLGCPDWEFDDMYSVAADLGYNGIEIRGIADEIYAPKIKVFQSENLESTKSKLANAGITLPMFTPGAHLTNNPELHDAQFEIKDYVMLADKLGSSYVRIMGESTPEPVISNPDMSATAVHLQQLCDFAAKFDISLLVETNGYLADSGKIGQLMEMIDRPNTGILWDIHHTVRFFGEAPADTVANIGKYIKHVHVKDSVRGRNGLITYMLTGYGDIPVEEAVSELNGIGYDGFYSYEWVKRWSRELAEPGIAFYQYINYMRDLI